DLFPGSEKKFLEKIVQFQIGLPALAENKMRDHVREGLEKRFENYPPYQSLNDKHRFLALWDGGLGHYLENLRQADRLLSSFAFHIGAFGSDDAEVNPLDLLVLEVFRLYEPSLYSAIRSSSK